MKIDDTFIEAVLSRVEGNDIDFKESQYDFSTGDPSHQKRKRAEFVKDIVAMFNTPSEEDGFIVLGVKKFLDNSYDVKGVTSHIDDSVLQSKFTDWVHPIPRFEYLPYTYKGKQIALIRVPRTSETGPCVPLKDLPSGEHQVLRQHALYIRRNSVNDLATLEDQKTVYGWFRGDLKARCPPDGGAWDPFIAEMGNFAADYYLGLVATRLPDDATFDSSALGLVNWAFVIDFDRQTDITGLLSKTRSEIGKRRSIHVVTKGDHPALNIDRGTYWYCANGLSGRSDTIPASEAFREWNRMYGVDLPRFINSLTSVTAARPVAILVLWNGDGDTSALSAVITTASAAFDASLNTVFVVSEQASDVHAIADRFEFPIFVIPMRQLCLGIKQFLDEGDEKTTLGVVLPSNSGAPLPVANDRAAWLAEELQLLHLSEGKHVSGTQTVGQSFLRGNEISWYELGLNYDVTRELTSKVLNRVKSDLGSRRPLRVNLYHAPGAGGTTVARRVMWELHNEFPCMLLLRTSPRETCERLAFIGALTGKPMLLVADAGAITDREADALYEVIAAAHLPVVLMQVNRRYGRPSNQRQVLYLESELTQLEAARFVHFLARENLSCQIELERVLQDATPGTLTPFYLALVAFGRDFVRLHDYVSRRLASLTETQLRCIAFLSLAHNFGQRAIPVQMFAAEFSVPASRPVKLDQLLPEATMELLVPAEANKWRTVHPLVAEECMRQIFAPGAVDPEIWLQRLSHWSLQFVEFCRGDSSIASEDGLDLVRRVFVLRDNSELLGSERAGTTHFSEALEQIPSPEGRLEVLRRLTVCFPDEAHFWAHLGRFLSAVLKEHKQASTVVEHSISLQPGDHVLHHMKGMVLRALVYQMISEKSPIGMILEQTEAAVQSFLKARQLDPDDEHGYISEVQMCLRVVDYCGQLQGGRAIIAVTNPNSPKWVREVLQSVEDLLSQVRQNREGERPSRYELQCRAELDAIYGDFSTALQRWDAMLSRNDVYGPPIRRQIIHVYLSRHNRQWSALRRDELERSLRLLEENLNVEPHNEKNLRLWLRAVRATEHAPSLDSVIERLAYWRANSDSLESVYYLFVMYSIKAFEGSTLARDTAEKCLDECRVRSRYRRNRSISFEWLGVGNGLPSLVHQDALGEWDRNRQFWIDASPLRRVKGMIRRIQGPESGEIETESGLLAFFVPGRSQHYKGQSENRRITCFIGFSYDGLRAWSVEDSP